MANRIPREDVMYKLANKLAILNDPFSKIHKQCQEIAKDRTVDPAVQLQALKLASNIAVSIVKIHTEAPTILAHARELPLNVQDSQKQLLLLLQQQRQQQQQNVIDDDEDDDDDDLEDDDDAYYPSSSAVVEANENNIEARLPSPLQ